MPERGRPTDYRAEYCERIVAHMSEGASITSFAAEIDVARSTINEWMSKQPEFSEAVKKAKAKCAAWWELRGRKLATGDEDGNPTLVIFGLKNMADDDWRDKREVEHSGEMNVTTKEQRDAAVAAATRADS